MNKKQQRQKKIINSMVLKVSIIIPVTRPKLAQKAKQAIDKQKPKNQKAEIILVDDRGKLSPAQRRNRGAKRAKGKILVFLDDDCLPQEMWLDNCVKAIESKQVGLVGGMVRGKSSQYFARCFDYCCFSNEQHQQRQKQLVSASSMVVKKQVFIKAGRFDEKMRIGEDADLCMRFKRLGYQTIYDPEIKVIHDHNRTTLVQLVKHQYNNGRTKGLIIEEHYLDSLLFKFLSGVSHPLVYWLLVLPLAMLAVMQTIVINFKNHPEIIIYTPGILFGKLALQIGVFGWLVNNKLVNKGF